MSSKYFLFSTFLFFSSLLLPFFFSFLPFITLVITDADTVFGYLLWKPLLLKLKGGGEWSMILPSISSEMNGLGSWVQHPLLLFVLNLGLVPRLPMGTPDWNTIQKMGQNGEQNVCFGLFLSLSRFRKYVWRDLCLLLNSNYGATYYFSSNLGYWLLSLTFLGSIVLCFSRSQN